MVQVGVMTKDQYRTYLAERHLQMFALKSGFLAPAESEKMTIEDRRKYMIKEAFAVADAFLTECESRNLKPWERDDS